MFRWPDDRKLTKHARQKMSEFLLEGAPQTFDDANFSSTMCALVNGNEWILFRQQASLDGNSSIKFVSQVKEFKAAVQVFKTNPDS